MRQIYFSYSIYIPNPILLLSQATQKALLYDIFSVFDIDITRYLHQHSLCYSFSLSFGQLTQFWLGLLWLISSTAFDISHPWSFWGNFTILIFQTLTGSPSLIKSYIKMNSLLCLFNYPLTIIAQIITKDPLFYIGQVFVMILIKVTYLDRL